MADAKYKFLDCIPDGAIDIANISPGDVVSRAWSFRVNGKFSIDTPLNNNPPANAFTSRRVVRGYDGFLYDFLNPGRTWLAQVNTWQAQFNPTVSDYQAAGMQQTWGIPMSFTVTLTFTETLFSDELLKRLADSIAYGNIEGANTAIPQDVSFNFEGVVRGRF